MVDVAKVRMFGQNALIERELVEKRGKLIFASDPVFSTWFKREYSR